MVHFADEVYVDSAITRSPALHPHQMFWNQKQRLAIGHAFRLKPAPTGRAYQVWFIVEGKSLGVKVFNSDADGHALFEDFALPVGPDA